MTLQDYVKELHKVQTLDREEELVLWQRFKNEGDTAARCRLIEAYQPLVFKQSESFAQRENIMDIIQEGTVGLIEAAENYDYTNGTAFSLYAMHRIRGRMLNFVNKEERKIMPDSAAVERQNFVSPFTLTPLALSVTERAERGELIGKVTAAMQRLPIKERTVLERVFWHSEKAEEVASQMELSASHIYRLQKRGLRRIRGMLAQFMHYWKRD